MGNEKKEEMRDDCRWYEKFMVYAAKEVYKHLCHLTPDSKVIKCSDCKNCEHYEKCDDDDK